jgi:hypothetical protein
MPLLKNVFLLALKKIDNQRVLLFFQGFRKRNKSVSGAVRVVGEDALQLDHAARVGLGADDERRAGVARQPELQHQHVQLAVGVRGRVESIRHVALLLHVGHRVRQGVRQALQRLPK